jgi:hypothetical protein
MNFIRAFEVYETVDEYGRLGRKIGVYTDKSDACSAAEGVGWYGGTGSVQRIDVIKLGDKFYKIDPSPIDLNNDEKHKQLILKEKALKKLTPEEREALGL